MFYCLLRLCIFGLTLESAMWQYST